MDVSAAGFYTADMSFYLNLHTTLNYQVNGDSEFLFKLALQHHSRQAILSEDLLVTGHDRHYEYTDNFGNRVLRLSAHGGALKVVHDAALVVNHFFVPVGDIPDHGASEIPDRVTPYLFPSRYCQSDQLLNFAQQEFGGVTPGYARVTAICKWVHHHIQFASGETGWNTSAMEVLTSRRGICRDYAHLAIALLRALNIPARFVTGYDYGADASSGPTDFHAYIEAYVGGRWYVEDPAGICKRTQLMRIAVGRDAADCAFASIFGPVRFQSMKITLHQPGDAAPCLTDSEEYAVSITDNDALFPQRHPIAEIDGSFERRASLHRRALPGTALPLTHVGPLRNVYLF